MPETNPFFGKTFSILGDSISTLRGYLPPFCKAFYMQNPAAVCSGISRPSDTWWAQVIEHFEGTLCINNSFSGSLVSGLGFPSATQMLRCGELHCNQGSYYYTLTDGKAGRKLAAKPLLPDVILIYMGTNDWLFRAPIGGQSKVHFDYAYAFLLDKLQQKYPHSVIVCSTLFQKDEVAPDALHPISAYNEIIRHTAAASGCFVAELTAADTEPETIDGVHPTYQGMQVLSERWIQCMTAFK